MKTHSVTGRLGFSEPMATRPKFHANDTSLDVLNVIPREVAIDDARFRAVAPAIDTEGFCLVPHTSAVRDFRVHEYERVHVDVSDATARSFYAQGLPENGRRVRRSAQYNVWRVLTPPPQDVPLAVCDARSLAAEDFIAADAIFDGDGAVAFSFEALLGLTKCWYSRRTIPIRARLIVYRTAPSTIRTVQPMRHLASALKCAVRPTGSKWGLPPPTRHQRKLPLAFPWKQC